MAASDVLVEIKDLRTYFYLAEGVVRAVDGLDLEIRHGRTLGVVGESGCGKTILAYSMLRLVPPPGRIVSGEILYFPLQNENGTISGPAIDITSLNPKVKTIRNIRGNQISMVFQEPMTAMIPVRTVGVQIMEAIILHRQVSKREARSIAIEMLARVKMPNPEKVIDDYPFQLSGGMRQRAIIAMALSCQPRLLIADEPTTALDVTTEAEILDLMRALRQDMSMAAMYITHNLGVIAEMADEVAVMYLGKIVEQTDVKSIFNKPLHPYTQGLLASVPRLDQAVAHSGEKRRLQTVGGMIPDPYNIPAGCPFHPRCPAAIPQVCDQIEAPLITMEAGHTVRCHLYTSENREERG